MTTFAGISSTHESEIDLDGFYPLAAADDDGKCGGT